MIRRKSRDERGERGAAQSSCWGNFCMTSTAAMDLTISRTFRVDLVGVWEDRLSFSSRQD